MFDFEAMIRRSIENIGDRDVAIAMPYDRPRRVMDELRAEGVIAGAIVDSAAEAQGEPGAAGWWLDRHAGVIQLSRGGPRTLALVGVDPRTRLPRHLLNRCFKSGMRRVVTVNSAGEIIEDIRPLTFSRLLRSLTPDAKQSPGLDFEAGYDALFIDIGEELRLPTDAFDPHRVVIFIGSLGPGGAERQASYLAAELARRGRYEVHIACLNLAPPDDFFRSEVEAAGAKVFEMPKELPELHFPRAARAMETAHRDYPALGMRDLLFNILQCASILRSLRPGIVHAWMDYYSSLGGIGATLVGAPKLILSGRSVAPDHFRIFQPYMKPAYKAIMARRNVDILNNSDAGARDYERWLDLQPGRIDTIRNGFAAPALDAKQARAEQRAELGWTNDDLVVGSILRFSEEKRPDFLIDAAIEVHHRRPDIRFAFFGGGPMREVLMARVARLGEGDIIKLPGRTERTWRALAAMDVFALTSRMEGLPNVLVEAQMMGVPVVCTGVGGMAETFEQDRTGLSASGASAAEFADAVLSILADPARLGRMSAAAKDFSRRTFSVEKMCDRMAAVYEH